DGIGASDDLVVVLKLVETGFAANDPAHTTTVAVVVDAADIYKFGDTIPAGYNSITLDNNDGLVIIEANDYNLAGYQIYGAQILSSTEGITGTGIDLNRATGTSGGSSGSEAFQPSTTDGDVLKI